MARTKKITHKLLLEGDPREALRLKLVEVRQDRGACRASGRAWRAVAALHRLECDLLRQLSEITQAAPPDALDGLSDAELEALANGESGKGGEAPAPTGLRLVAK